MMTPRGFILHTSWSLESIVFNFLGSNDLIGVRPPGEALDVLSPSRRI